MPKSLELVIERYSPAILDGKLVGGVVIEALGDEFFDLLKPGSLMTESPSHIFSTALDDQRSVSIRLHRTHPQNTKDKKYLGELILAGLPPRPRGMVQIGLRIGIRGGTLIVKVEGDFDTLAKFHTHEDQDTEVNKPDYLLQNATCMASKNTPEEGADRSQVKQSELNACLDELDNLVGLRRVKDEIRTLVDYVLVQSLRRAEGKKQPELSKHLVFVGNPGTGKTTVARLIGRIFHLIGVCRHSNVIETDRAGMVAAYVGQTALKTKGVIESALGGVLFIDEAYTLARKQSGENDFGQEAIDCLLKEMEDHRDDLVVIVAGYPDEMDVFVRSNPGLESRFSRKIFFDNYSDIEMVRIFSDLCVKNEYKLEGDANLLLMAHFARVRREAAREFANGRTVRNLFESILKIQATRVAQSIRRGSDYSLDLITVQDIKHAMFL